MTLTEVTTQPTDAERFRHILEAKRAAYLRDPALEPRTSDDQAWTVPAVVLAALSTKQRDALQRQVAVLRQVLEPLSRRRPLGRRPLRRRGRGAGCQPADLGTAVGAAARAGPGRAEGWDFEVRSGADTNSAPQHQVPRRGSTHSRRRRRRRPPHGVPPHPTKHVHRRGRACIRYGRRGRRSSPCSGGSA